MKKLLLTILFLLPAAALAHVGDHSMINWKAGFLHPLTGLDHMFALLAIGVWLAQSETRPKIGFIVGFAAVLATGIVVGMQFTHVTFESGIAATLVVLGVLLVCAIRGSRVFRISVVAATAAIHGFIHGTELLPGPASFAIFLIISSIMVIGIAMAAGMFSQKFAKGLISRIAGVLLMLIGFALAFTGT